MNKKSSRDGDDMRVILYWNPDFTPGYLFSRRIDSDVLANAGCPISNCFFTDDIDYFNQSDVVIFFATQLYSVPTYRFPHQHFVFFELESPLNHRSPTLFSHQTRYNFFNRTMTYRRDSDIVIQELHGKIVQRKDSSNRNVQMNQCIQRSGFERRKRKSKLVAWFASNCHTPIRREDYIAQLNKFIQVDVYGKCGNLSCTYGNASCYEILRKDYKFYLAFENSFCPDYVTEKLFRPLYYDTVPVVMGGVNYSLFAPPNSFINAEEFSSPKELADYLLLLNQSEELYSRYFDWKINFKVDLFPLNGWCDLCSLAHDPKPKFKVYNDIQYWWKEEKKCENKTVI